MDWGVLFTISVIVAMCVVLGTMLFVVGGQIQESFVFDEYCESLGMEVHKRSSGGGSCIGLENGVGVVREFQLIGGDFYPVRREG